MPVFEDGPVRHHGPTTPGPRIPKNLLPAGDYPPNSSGAVANKIWSGLVLTSNSSSWNSSTAFYAIYGQWGVPIAQQAYNTCTGGWDESFTWIGIDGYGLTDLAQGGTEQDAYCANNFATQNTVYRAWYEFLPQDQTEIVIQNFSIYPGDDINAALVINSNTTASFYLTNITTNQSTAFQFSNSGANVSASSAEWIMERPSINGVPTTLMNYGYQFFGNTVADQRNGNINYSGSPSGTANVTPLAMTDDSGNVISYVPSYGNASFQTTVAGSAQ
jgi:Peptidase A4 family